MSSLGSFFKQTLPETRIVAVEAESCTPFYTSIQTDQMAVADKVSRIWAGSSVKKVGDFPFHMGKTCIDEFVTVSENKLAEAIIRLYSIGLVCEPMGALGMAGLNKIQSKIKGKNVVCVLSGANMDLTRLE